MFVLKQYTAQRMETCPTQTGKASLKPARANQNTGNFDNQNKISKRQNVFFTLVSGRA